MYQTIAVAVVVLILGAFLKRKISFLEKFCIPAPVIGGLIFAIFTLICYSTGILEIDFDDTLKEVCMVFFFTSVGFQANLKVLKSGGKPLLIFLVLVIVLIITQNFTAIGLANLLGLDSLTGMTTGSIPMVGGHGTAGAFGPVLEDFGISGATTVCTAAATFGLVAGSLMGGPIGNRLIKKHNLLETIKNDDDTLLVEEEEKHERHFSMYAPAVFQLIIAVGIGTIFSKLLSLTGMTFPIYIGAMIAAAIMRNIGEYTGKITIHMGEINDLGGICLSLFLGIAMITLKLWQLADLALPLVILLAGQVALMFLFSYIVVFNVMGRNYDAAVLVAGTCGFGMGATPNAMANMQAICEKDADYIYCDEATFKGNSINHMITMHFKPDYAPDNLLANNYICHFSVFSRKLLEGEELFRTAFDGAQDHDMILRLTDRAQKIVHVPRLMYYWRSHAGSTAASIDAKPYAIEAAKGAVADHLKKHGFKHFQITSTRACATIFRIRHQILGDPKISIVIANKDHVEDLKRCITSIQKNSTWSNYEIIVVENNSTTQEIRDYYSQLLGLSGNDSYAERCKLHTVCGHDGGILHSEDGRISVVTYHGDFNYSAVNNLGVSYATGDYILLLNNDTEVITANWME